MQYNEHFLRAHDDSDVVRTHKYSSASPLTDDSDDEKPSKKKTKRDDSDDTLVMFQKAMASTEARLDARVKLEESRLEIERQREEREMERLRQQEEREAARLRRQEERDEEERKLKKWNQAMVMMEHANPNIRQMGEKLAAELAKAEGL
jgi:hypothetical protein